MSLAQLKAKETKGKQKLLPKLKAILANPNKTRCPILNDTEIELLKYILQAAIQESKLPPRRFATEKGICLGLESSLRSINNQTSSCVFISLSIKPNYIIGLIARNAETKDETQPVYAQPKLENLVEEIFGVHALCMVLPKNLLVIAEALDKWVQERKKPAKVHKAEVIKRNIKKKVKKPKLDKIDKMDLKEDNLETVPVKEWTGEYISFGKDIQRIDNLNLEGVQAVDALSKIIDKIPPSTIILPNAALKVDKDNGMDTVVNESPMEENEDSENSDNFLVEYKTLTVHKIKGNPIKKPKKKRKKNKKKISGK